MRVTLFCLLIVLGFGQAQAQVLEAQIAGRIEPLSITATSDDYAFSGPEWWLASLSRLGTGFVRLHITVDQGHTTVPAIIAVEGRRGGQFSYAVADIGPEGLWTGLVHSGDIVVTLIAFERPETLRITLDKIMVEAEVGSPYSIWGGEDETLHINDLGVPDEIRSFASPVARLSFIRDGLPRNCTGYLVSDDILATNEHCIADQAVCSSMVALFGYEYDPQNQLKFGRQYRCAQFLEADFELDVALLRLRSPAGVDFGLITVTPTDVIADDPLVLIQHPAGKPKQVSFINCDVLRAPVDGRGDDTDIAHSCDTAEGSSGAPILTLDGTWVGMHHYGFFSGQVDTWTDNRAVSGAQVGDWVLQKLDEHSTP